jgi:hypothetical protein
MDILSLELEKSLEDLSEGAFWCFSRKMKLDEELWWYLDTRRFGSAVHSGFGPIWKIGIVCDRNINIRDVIFSQEHQWMQNLKLFQFKV